MECPTLFDATPAFKVQKASLKRSRKFPKSQVSMMSVARQGLLDISAKTHPWHLNFMVACIKTSIITLQIVI